MLDAVRFKVEPAQIGELLPAVGAAGVAFTTTATVPAAEVQPPTVTVTLYVPAMASVAPGRVGFCADEVYPPGPVHEYVAPEIVPADKLMVAPSQTGLLLAAEGAAGEGSRPLASAHRRRPRAIARAADESAPLCRHCRSRAEARCASASNLAATRARDGSIEAGT